MLANEDPIPDKLLPFKKQAKIAEKLIIRINLTQKPSGITVGPSASILTLLTAEFYTPV